MAPSTPILTLNKAEDPKPTVIMTTLKLVIRGAAAAPKTSQLEMHLSINGPAQSGELTFALKEVISNDMMSARAQPGHISVPSGGFQQNYNLGEFFNTPKTGAFLVTASLNGNKSNELPIKILL